MASLPRFRDRREDLRQRLARLEHVSPQALVRRRLERELRELVEAELKAEARKRPAPVPEYPEEEGHELTWWQR